MYRAAKSYGIHPLFGIQTRYLYTQMVRQSIAHYNHPAFKGKELPAFFSQCSLVEYLSIIQKGEVLLFLAFTFINFSLGGLYPFTTHCFFKPLNSSHILMKVSVSVNRSQKHLLTQA
jgi:hypothetical protein